MNQPTKPAFPPGTAIYLHTDGHECLWADHCPGATVVLLGVAQEDGSIKRHRVVVGIKPTNPDKGLCYCQPCIDARAARSFPAHHLMQPLNEARLWALASRDRWCTAALIACIVAFLLCLAVSALIYRSHP